MSERCPECGEEQDADDMRTVTLYGRQIGRTCASCLLDCLEGVAARARAAIDELDADVREKGEG